MNPRVVDVKPENDYMLRLYFTNGEVRRFDVKPYLEFEVFQALKDNKIFQTAIPYLDSVQWSNEADLCPDTLYLDSVPVATL
jgi:hypothetical protein